MISSLVADMLPEWEPFAHAANQLGPRTGTWCEAWTVRDIVVHQAGNAAELARVLDAHMAGAPVSTRTFEERERSYRALGDDDLWKATEHQVEQLAQVAFAARDALREDDLVGWTGRTMRPCWFPEHMREELVLHRWDVAGDDATARAALGEQWMTDHSVVAVGVPLLARGAAGLDLGAGQRVEGRLRSATTDDVVVAATTEGNNIWQGAPEGPATLECDAAARVLFLWGRRPTGPDRWRSDAGPDALRSLRALLRGY
jgi:hypothetical protein